MKKTYTKDVARGWESKSVESQIDAAEEHRQHRQPMLSADKLREQTMRESLELSRERILRELHESEHPRRREQLEAALAHLDLKLQQLNVSSSTPPVV